MSTEQRIRLGRERRELQVREAPLQLHVRPTTSHNAKTPMDVSHHDRLSVSINRCKQGEERGGRERP
jgi:hypothetical protein